MSIINTILILLGLLSCYAYAEIVTVDASLFTQATNRNPAFCVVREVVGGPAPGQPPAAITVGNTAEGYSTNYFQFNIAGLRAATKASFKTRILDTSGGIFMFKDSAAVTQPLGCDNIPHERNFSKSILAPMHGGLNDYSLDITELYNEYIAQGETTLTLLLTADLGVSVVTSNYRRLEVEYGASAPAPVTQAPGSGTCTASVVAVARLAEGSTWVNDGKSFHIYDIVVTNTGTLSATYVAVSITGSPMFNIWGLSTETGAMFLNGNPLAPGSTLTAGFITTAAISARPNVAAAVSSIQCA